jgi:hypothetical protein
MVKVFTMVKGEVDIVEDWVKYHGTLFGYQNLFVIDNMSLDGTFETLINLKNLYNINVIRKRDYKKKGEYMTNLLRKCGNNEIVFPIDIDEFIVYYDKPSNKMICDVFSINNYINSLPRYPIFKMNYIQSKILREDGYNRAAVESEWGRYEDNGNFAKSFFWSDLFKGEIDHGNHYHCDKFISTKLRLVHFHTRNLDQIKKKVFNNVKGLGHKPFDIEYLKNKIIENPIREGQHHIRKQISILENSFVFPIEECSPDDVNLKPLCDFINSIHV